MASSVLLEKVVPALGAIISTLMYAAPIKAVLKAVSVKNLGVSRAVTWGLRASAQSSAQMCNFRSRPLSVHPWYMQDLNPIPFAVTVANTIIWLVYGESLLLCLCGHNNAQGRH